MQFVPKNNTKISNAISIASHSLQNIGVCPDCVHGSCEARGGCICNPQWQGTNCNQDVDECASAATNDCATIATCVNQSPGFTCGKYLTS